MNANSGNSRLKQLESLLLDSILGDRAEGGTNSVFILGAPRTGSTFFYQLLVAATNFPFISNLVNEFFPSTPIIGLQMQINRPSADPISYRSNYGKTEGLSQPSEGSGPMTFWFGGGVPAQSKSRRVIPSREEHFLSTIRATNALFNQPLVIKNAWNCFRIEYLASALPDAKFIWIRRNITESAISDLDARISTKGSPLIWNSATPDNYQALCEMHYTAQVVENQYEFNNAVCDQLRSLEPERYTEVWYEDICGNAKGSVKHVCKTLGLSYSESRLPDSPTDRAQRPVRVSDSDLSRLESYIEKNSQRFSPFFHSG